MVFSLKRHNLVCLRFKFQISFKKNSDFPLDSPLDFPFYQFEGFVLL